MRILTSHLLRFKVSMCNPGFWNWGTCWNKFWVLVNIMLQMLSIEFRLYYTYKNYILQLYMCTGQRLCVWQLRYEQLHVENHQIHSKESFASSLSFLENMAKLCWFRQPLFQCSVIMRVGLAHVFYQPYLSGPRVCLHVGLISVPWSPFLFLHLLHSSLLSVCLYRPWRFAAHWLCVFPWVSVLGFFFPYPDYWTCLSLCLLPSDFGGKRCMAVIFVFSDLLSIVFVLCMKFDGGVWITFWMIFCRCEGGCKLQFCQ